MTSSGFFSAASLVSGTGGVAPGGGEAPSVGGAGMASASGGASPGGVPSPGGATSPPGPGWSPSTAAAWSGAGGCGLCSGAGSVSCGGALTGGGGTIGSSVAGTTSDGSVVTGTSRRSQPASQRPAIRESQRIDRIAPFQAIPGSPLKPDRVLHPTQTLPNPIVPAEMSHFRHGRDHATATLAKTTRSPRLDQPRFFGFSACQSASLSSRRKLNWPAPCSHSPPSMVTTSPLM